MTPSVCLPVGAITNMCNRASAMAENLIGLEDVLAPGKYPQNVKARSLLCYWATRELGMTTIELSKKLKLSQPTISQSAKRGQKIKQEEGFCLIEKCNQ